MRRWIRIHVETQSLLVLKSNPRLGGARAEGSAGVNLLLVSLSLPLAWERGAPCTVHMPRSFPLSFFFNTESYTAPTSPADLLRDADCNMEYRTQTKDGAHPLIALFPLPPSPPTPLTLPFLANPFTKKNMLLSNFSSQNSSTLTSMVRAHFPKLDFPISSFLNLVLREKIQS